MSRIYSLEPIEDKNSKIIILGSMPGRASLAAGQYYAHAQNSFWRIMAELLQIDCTAPYEVKIKVLKSAGIALWDVLESCYREGSSLDAMIEHDTQIANNFQTFLIMHPHITQVFFNGTKAEQLFKQHFPLGITSRNMSYLRLPSTSPAHASMGFADKLNTWRIALYPLLKNSKGV